MKNQRILPLVAVVVFLGSVHALAGADVKVIANSSVNADVISAGELKGVFLEESNSLDGTHVEPVLEKDGSVHEAFLHNYLGRTDADLQTYYRALVFSGRGSMPKELGSDAEVVAYVARTKGAIGYVSTATGSEGVKILPVLSDNGDRRTLITRVEPEYPETLQRLQIGGTVRLAITISAKGKVDNVVLLGGNPILAESAIAAVKQWLYSTGHSRTTTEVSIPFDSRR